jgi:hypothetical protein
MNVFLFKLKPKSNPKVAHYWFYGMLITCKYMTFYKKLRCDTKNEPPYLANIVQWSKVKLPIINQIIICSYDSNNYLNDNLLSNLQMENIKSVIISKVSFQ